MRTARRPATGEDYDFVREAHHAGFRDVAERQFGPWNEAFQDRAFDREWQDCSIEILEWEGNKCGYIVVENRDADVHVRQLVVHPDFQNRGIGSTVLREVIDMAAQRAVPVNLGVFRVSRALQLYERLDFEQVGRTTEHVLLRWVPPGDPPSLVDAPR